MIWIEQTALNSQDISFALNGILKFTRKYFTDICHFLSSEFFQFQYKFICECIFAKYAKLTKTDVFD